MSRLGMLYAITDDEVELLKNKNENDMYGFMLDSIENNYISTSRACDLNKAWEGIHFCIHNGAWVEDESVQSKVIFCGVFLLDSQDYVITLKNTDDINEIVAFLDSVNLEDIIRSGYKNIDPSGYTLPMGDDGLDFILGWSEELKSFYENAQKNNLNVIFTVDL